MHSVGFLNVNSLPRQRRQKAQAHVQAQATSNDGAKPKFSGITANMFLLGGMPHENADHYEDMFRQRHGFASDRLHESVTRIFRDRPVILGLMPYLDKTAPTDVHVFGSSDGSEAFAYAIALRELMGGSAKKNVTVTGVDRVMPLVELAKTGHLVCTDKEKEVANDPRKEPGSPLAGDGWNHYLKSSDAPKTFAALEKKYPLLSDLTHDDVAEISIGKGMDWYKVNQDDLPPIAFKHTDLNRYIKESSPKAKQQVVSIANVLTDYSKGPNLLLQTVYAITEKAKKENQAVYLALGIPELNMLYAYPDAGFGGLTQMGYASLPIEEYVTQGNPVQGHMSLFKRDAMS